MMEDLMKILLEGAQTQKQQQPQAKEPNILTDILEGVLKGGQAAPQRGQQQQQPDMFNMADLLNVVLGGGKGGAQGQVNPLLAPIVNTLAEKLGISPAIAQIIVTFATSALLSRGKDNKGGGLVGGAQQGFDLDDLLEGDFAYSSGLAQQLSQQSGLDEDEAAYGLQEAMMMLSGHPSFSQSSASARPKAQPSPNKLDSLLDTWEVDG
ncbi:MAG: hypothetical protein GY943_16430 [Chloroflexi bacterium]|nr:hypothetical protein [Chloroflexota bacterium]